MERDIEVVAQEEAASLAAAVVLRDEVEHGVNDRELQVVGVYELEVEIEVVAQEEAA